MSNITVIKKKWENFRPRSDYQQTIQDCAMVILEDSPSEKEQFLLLFHELISLDILISTNCLTYTVMFYNIRSLLNHYQINIESGQGLRIATAVGNALLTGDE